MLVFSHAKLNIGLRVQKKLANGYHQIETILYPLPWYDIIEILPNKVLGFYSTGFDFDTPTQDNLIIRAYHMLSRDFKLKPVALHVQKNIPMGAGLGGGSANAAATLLGLNSMFNLGIKLKALAAYALKLGSGCPFFLQKYPCLAQGIGNQLSVLSGVSLRPNYALVVYPNIRINTKAAYVNIKVQNKPLNFRPCFAKGAPKMLWRTNLSNDFSDQAILKYPILTDIKTRLYDAGAWYVSLSGSGSAIFGLFSQVPPNKPWPKDYTIWQGQLT